MVYCFAIVHFTRGAKRILRLSGKRERQDPLQAKRAENFQSLEINLGKLLLVSLLGLPDLEALGVMRSLGACDPGAICPLSSLSTALYFTANWSENTSCFLRIILIFSDFLFDETNLVMCIYFQLVVVICCDFVLFYYLSYAFCFVPLGLVTKKMPVAIYRP